ncbi:MAG TPA: hypothetical protein VLH59_09695 [Ignavibacteriaceae bacterium]|nr:hypothetical protein [Ignavibacteriaceae bacterium]
MNRIFLLLIFIMLALSCGEKKDQKPKSDLELKMNSIAEGYVKLVLEVGKYDPMYVDAYYGPKEWKPKEENLTFDSTANVKLISEADSLLNELELLSEYNATELETLRYRYIYKQLFAVKTKIIILNGSVLPFDLESRALYDVSPTETTEEDLQMIIDELVKILPGKGDVSERITNFKKKFEIPKDKIATVFDAAIKECKRRTSNYIDLPAGEKFKVEYVVGKPWGAYNWYKGNLFSVIQIATDFPVYIDSPVGLAAHEGYPGHHVYNILLEQNLVKNKGWIEYTVYPLYSPQSLIAEGTAVFGEEILFPGDERMKFEKEVLFPLAKLDTTDADIYYKVLSLQEKLSGAGVLAARNYLNGDWTKDETVAWLQKFQLRTKERAEKFLSFIETYRSYVVTYNAGDKIIREYVESNGGADDNLARKWEILNKLISTPQTPSGLMD